jgi:hypothetical protein
MSSTMISSMDYPEELFELFKGTALEFLGTHRCVGVYIDSNKHIDIEDFFACETFEEAGISDEILLCPQTLAWNNLPDIQIKLIDGRHMCILDGHWSFTT